MSIAELPQVPSQQPLLTSRLTLKSYAPDTDAAAFFTVLDQNRERLLAAFPSRVAAVGTLEDATQVLAGYSQDWHTRRLFVFGIWHTLSGEYLGDISLKPSWGRIVTAEIGYYLAEAAEGQGYAQEALAAAILFGFDAPISAARLDIRCYATNPRSCAVAERAGFRRLPVRPRLWPLRSSQPEIYYYTLLRPE
ncbi:GNAT family N-acetyltransferase [Hymenobacter lucidus]|uniref:GNAT family N-acetyltransferase n=1 Tax=Hymenobacter lucidus TaxID=2880930 RepID=A0ABS8AP01_9BACT|nr:GNAT family N-acetyltransferase [Hymenobacter lucidus]MCB2407169.1 GNAT family N-acetyltransferase [Hymenobacter lucidus]